MRNKNVDNLSDALVDKLISYWDEKISDIEILEATDVPFRMLTIEFSLYNYIRLRLNIEHDTVGFSAYGFGGIYSICDRTDLFDKDIDLEILDDSVKLRIPDKFLRAHGWIVSP